MREFGDQHDELLSVEVVADTRAFRRELQLAEGLGQSFGRSMSRAFSDIAVGGRNVSDTLRGLALDLSRMTLRAAFKPVETLVSGGVQNLLGGLGGLAVSTGRAGAALPLPFAKGGVVSQPALFPMENGRTGLMGERGAEAILPLARGPDGRLGVKAEGGGGVNITFHVTASDAASFQRSETQIAAMLSRLVSRGQRNL